MKFVQRHPEAAGRLIFQDRENVVKAATENGRREGLVPMPYDFFERQPVKGLFATLVPRHREKLNFFRCKSIFLSQYSP